VQATPDDTIAAIATPIGAGGLGIVRVSGTHAVAVVRAVFRDRRGRPVEGLPSHRVRFGSIMHPRTGAKLDEVLVTYMRAPHSYTREDVVEISGHGGIGVMARILEALVASGARLAEPGEFTKRAFLNGRLDLSQAEAVIDLIQAQTEESHRPNYREGCRRPFALCVRSCLRSWRTSRVPWSFPRRT
jgi:tRNA modification GTPase